MKDDRNNAMWHGPNGAAKAATCDDGKARGMAGPSGAAKAAPYDEAKVCREGEGGAPFPRRKSLRNANINYRAGWWAVTVQVAKNKSLLGAIVGDKVVLNELGKAVEAYWRGLPAKYPELEIFDYVVMPNHFHALLRIHWRPTNREHHLGFLMSRFKGGTSYLYGKMRQAGSVGRVGFSQPGLWQRDYWDDLISSDEEFAEWQKYIRENPENWSRDRYGACTTYMFGDPELLNAPRIAFVASQGFFASELRPRKIYGPNGPSGPSGPAKAGPSEEAIPAEGAGPSEEAIPAEGAAPSEEAGRKSEGAALAAPPPSPVLISTFTSAQEREALRRALAKGKRLIAVFPQGIPPENELSPELRASCRAGRALLISPQPPGSRLNKKIATWCNEYVLRHAEEIWVGDISPNGMLSAMLQGVHVSGKEDSNHAHVGQLHQEQRQDRLQRGAVQGAPALHRVCRRARVDAFRCSEPFQDVCEPDGRVASEMADA